MICGLSIEVNSVCVIYTFNTVTFFDDTATLSYLTNVSASFERSAENVSALQFNSGKKNCLACGDTQ